jgi:pimeloyl-ACP methyl ester carboxylesterase
VTAPDGGLHVTVSGTGPRVVLVHGTLTTARQTWAKQQELAERWTLVVPDRRGYPPNPPDGQSDFEAEAGEIAALLGDGAHLVGHSYGGLVALFAAAHTPEAVRSLTLVETPGMGLLRGEPAVEARITEVLALHEIDDAREYYVSFVEQLGAPVAGIPDPLPPATEHLVRLLMAERPPWEASFPGELAMWSTPTLVITGGWDPVLEHAAEALADAFGARSERAVLPGGGHVVQRLGAPFNDVLERFLLAAES